MQISDKTVGIWYLPFRGGNVLWFLTESDKPGRYDLNYRFRYDSEESTDPFDGKDRKSHWSAHIEGVTREEALAKQRAAVELAALACPGGPSEAVEIVCKSGEEYMAELAKHPWAHIRKEAQ